MSRRSRHYVYNEEDEEVLLKMREILTTEPCTGVPGEPNQLLGHVYIGSQSNAESLRLLRRLGITHVLNCAGYKGPRPKPDMSPYEGLGIDYYEFQAEDHDDYDITRHFSEAFNFLDEVKRRNGVALVHCYLGINRSAATCAGYMMVHNRWTLLQVVKLIKQRRRVCLANRGFQRQLIRYAKSRHLLDRGVGSSSKPRRRSSSSMNDMDAAMDAESWCSSSSRPPKPRSYSSETVPLAASSPRRRPAPSSRSGRRDYWEDSPRLYSVGSEPLFSSTVFVRQDPVPTPREWRRERVGSLPSIKDASLTYRVYMAGRSSSPRPSSPSVASERSIPRARSSSRERASTRYYRGIYNCHS